MITKSSHSNDDDDDDVVRKIKADQVLCYSFNANGPYGIRLKKDWNQFFHQNCTGVHCTAFLHTAMYCIALDTAHIIVNLAFLSFGGWKLVNGLSG